MEKDNVFTRLVEIFKPDFISKRFNELSSSKTWKFWFFWNTVFSIVVICIVIFNLEKLANKSEAYLNTNYPDAKIIISNGTLSLEGIEEPVFISPDEKTVFVVDTKNVKYDEKILDKYETGAFVSANKIVNKKNKVETQQISLSQIKEEFSFTTKDLITVLGKLKIFLYAIAAIGILLYFNIIRLASAVFWALLFWLLALIMKVRDINFEKMYFSVLNFYIIPLVLSSILLLCHMAIPFLTFVVFLVLFIINFVTLNKKVSLPPEKVNDQATQPQK